MAWYMQMKTDRTLARNETAKEQWWWLQPVSGKKRGERPAAKRGKGSAADDGRIRRPKRVMQTKRRARCQRRPRLPLPHPSSL